MNLIQDTFLLAYKGLIDYIEPLRIITSLMKINSQQFVIWRALQWHWELLADTVEYLPETWKKFKVRAKEFDGGKKLFFYFVGVFYQTYFIHFYNNR